jgi:light-regulated signal transduction histidine kinase (bacteriophytochrome)
MEGFERAERIRESLRRKLAGASDFDAALGAELDTLRAALRCDGAALWLGSRWRTVGSTPDPRLAAELLEWLAHKTGSDEVVSSDRAREWRSPLIRDDEIAGVMALCLGGREDWLLLFRKEQLQDVQWAGEPAKALVSTDDGIRIAPRRSFASWREQVRGRSLPWNDADHRAGERLHRLLHESRRLALAGIEDLAGLEDHERKRRLLAQRERLADLSQLLEGLVHLDPGETRSLEARIQAFDQELREFIRRPPVPALNA